MLGSFPYHAETSSYLLASTEQAFAHLDDHTRLSEHMSRRSWRMGWGRMDLRLDTQAGRAVGSHIRLAGRAFGLWLELEEVITEYRPPFRKVWETVGTPRLLVVGPYRMGFSLSPREGPKSVSRWEEVGLTVFIDYALPQRGLPRFLGLVFGHWYARWCTGRMVADAREAFPLTARGPAV